MGHIQMTKAPRKRVFARHGDRVEQDYKDLNGGYRDFEGLNGCHCIVV